MKRLVVRIAGEVSSDLYEDLKVEKLEVLARDLFGDASPADMDLRFDGFYVEEV